MLKRLIVEFLAALAVLVLMCFVVYHSASKDKSVKSATLPTNDTEKLLVDPKAHTITVITRTGTTKQYFSPNVVSAISVNRSGTATLHTRVWGTEHGLALGAAYSDKLRVGLAVPLMFYKRLELEPMVLVGVSPKVDIRLSVALAYNVYDNTSLFLGIQTNREPVGGIQVRF